MGVYGLELPLIDPWTSSGLLLNALIEIEDTTDDWVWANRDTLNADTEPKSQIPELVSVIYGCFSERIEYLRG
jgi:nuclear pore complex protein Nup133